MEAKQQNRSAAPAEDETRSEDALLDSADRHLLRNYAPARMVLDRGEGCWLVDTEGRRYLDFCAGVAVCCLGHGNPELSRVIAEQASRLVHVSNYFHNLENVLLAEELCAATGFDRAFFCNSGAEANEAMLKLARRHAHQRGDVGRKRIVAFDKAFHGRTMGALALTGNPRYMEGFEPHMPGVSHVPYGDMAAVEATMGPDVAAVLVETVQGEGGVNVAPEGFLQALRSLCDRHGSLLLVDEVQTGMGRTGKLLGCEHSGLRPDALVLAKGLGGGVPIGAMLLREPLAAALTPGTHGSTFGGNPLASACARTVLRTLQAGGLVEHAAQVGDRLAAGLEGVAQSHPQLCTGARGQGLLRALTLTDAVIARDLLAPAREEGLLVTAAGPSALRFTPPLVVSEEEVDEAVRRADATLTRVERTLGGT